MKISVAIYLILAALAVGGVFAKTRRYKIGLYSVGAVLLIFMAAFRDFSVGPDTQQYLGKNGFLEIVSGNSDIPCSTRLWARFIAISDLF